MEPLSATASILTILGTGGVIANGLATLRNLKRAPDVLSALNNEVNDAHHLISDVDDLLRKARDQGARRCPPSLLRSLERMRSVTLDLQEFIAYSLTTFSTNCTGSFVRVDKSVYIRAEKRTQSLKDAMRTERLTLASTLGLLSTFVFVYHTHCSSDSNAMQLTCLGKDSTVQTVVLLGREFGSPCSQLQPATARSKTATSNNRFRAIVSGSITV